MNIFRSDSGDLHREGRPAIDLPHLKQYWWQGKLHNSRGYAVEYVKSGLGDYYWKGIYIPFDIWNECKWYTASQILCIQNVELRRCIIEKVGYERLLDGGRVLDNSPPNKLWGVVVSGDEEIRFMELENSTPEPDGTRKIYYIRVPPNIETLKSGLAWSFDVGEDFTYVSES